MRLGKRHAFLPYCATYLSARGVTTDLAQLLNDGLDLLLLLGPVISRPFQLRQPGSGSQDGALLRKPVTQASRRQLQLCCNGGYIHWYNENRIKISQGSLSPIEYRESLGLMA